MNNTADNRCCKNCKALLTQDNTKQYTGQLRNLVFCDKCQNKILNFLKYANKSGSAYEFFKKNAEKLNSNGIEPDGLRYVYAFCRKLDEHKATEKVDIDASEDMPEIDDEMMAAITALARVGIEVSTEPAPEKSVMEPEETSVQNENETAASELNETADEETTESVTEEDVPAEENVEEASGSDAENEADTTVQQAEEMAEPVEPVPTDEIIEEAANRVADEPLYEDTNTDSKKKFIIIAAAILVVLIIITAILFAVNSGDKENAGNGIEQNEDTEDQADDTTDEKNTADNSVYQNYTYTVSENGGIELLSYTPSDADETTITVPAEIGGVKVEKLADNIFKSNLTVETVILPDSLCEIGAYAFSGCSSLKSIEIPASLEVIGDDAFSGCFNLDNINIPDSVKQIGAYALNDTIWFTRNKDEFIVVGDGLLIGYQGDKEQVVLPENVKKICGGAFAYFKGIKSVELGNSAESIENRAFENCISLESVAIPQSVAYIGESAFPNDGTFGFVVTENSYAHTYAIDHNINCKFN